MGEEASAWGAAECPAAAAQPASPCRRCPSRRDTAGQERYESLAPLYYRGASAALVVYAVSR